MEEQAWPGRATEAMSWLSTGISVGVACGATAAGFILDAFGPRWGYAFAASCGTASVLLCLAGLRRLAGPPPAPGPDAGPLNRTRGRTRRPASAPRSTYQVAWL